MLTPYGTNSTARPILAPHFSTTGPLTPGTNTRIVLPIKNERNTAETNLRVRFFGDGLTFDPEELVIPRIDGFEQRDVVTTATILPRIDDRRLVRVWAELSANNGLTHNSAEATAQIAIRTGIALTDSPDGIIVANKGDETVAVILSADGALTADIDFDEETGKSEPIHLAPSEARKIRIESYTGRINARANNGERAIVYRRSTETDMPEITARLEVVTPEDGARHNEICPFMLTISNTGIASARDVQLDLRIPDGVEISTELLTIDDIRVLSADRTIEDGTFTLKFGRLAPGATVIARGGFTVSADTLTDDPNVTLDGTILAANIPPIVVRSGITVDRAPVFVPNSTFIGDHITNDNGTIDVDITITHPEPRPINHAYLQLELEGARLEAVYTAEWGPQLPVQPSTVGNRRVINVKLGRIEPDQRLTPRIHLIPTPSSTEEHIIRMRAILNADSNNVDLGERRYVIPGRADLTSSHLDKRDTSPLRLNMPTTIHLMLHNTGTVPARDVRVSFTPPDNVHLAMPMEPTGRWYTLTNSIPPGGSAGLPIVAHLIAPPTADIVTIGASVDAENAPEVTLEAITLMTPSSPHLRATVPTTASPQQGLLHVASRITNEGDGVAREVSISVPHDDHPLPRMTTVDGAFIEETTPISKLVEGIDLGDLLPGTYRDVTWMVSPPATTYRASCKVTSANGDEPIELSSLPTVAHIQKAFASTLPAARPLDEQTATTPPSTPHVPRANILDFAAAVTSSETAALPAAPVDAPRAGGPAYHELPAAPPAATDTSIDTTTDIGHAGFDTHTEITQRTAHEVGAPPELPHAPQPPTEPVPTAAPTGLRAAIEHFARPETENHDDDANDEDDVELSLAQTGDGPQGQAGAAGEADVRAGDDAAAHAADAHGTQPANDDHVTITIPVAPLGNTSDGDDLFGRGAQADLVPPRATPPWAPPTREDGTHAAPPTTNAPTLTGGMARRLLDFAAELNDHPNLSGWRHLILIRVLADGEQKPLADVADAIAQNVLPPIIQGTFTFASPGFIASLTSYDDALRSALASIGRPVNGENAAALDAALANGLPLEYQHDGDIDPAVHDRLRAAYRDYVEKARAYIGSEQNARRTKPDRDQVFTSTPIQTLDRALETLAAAVAEV
jgi:hypothetical protein